jgi:hypothetical protein
MFITNFVSVSTSAARYQDISLNPQKLAGQCGKLKCCLNYEVDAYIDAQKHSPSTNVQLNVGDGLLYHQKTDIFKGVMFYTSDKEGRGAMVEIPVRRVKEIIAMNRKGVIPPNAVEASESERVMTFSDGIGEDSLSRFDDAKQKSGKKRKNQKTQRRERGDRREQNEEKSAVVEEQNVAEPKAAEPKMAEPQQVVDNVEVKEESVEKREGREPRERSERNFNRPRRNNNFRRGDRGDRGETRPSAEKPTEQPVEQSAEQGGNENQQRQPQQRRRHWSNNRQRRFNKRESENSNE